MGDNRQIALQWAPERGENEGPKKHGQGQQKKKETSWNKRVEKCSQMQLQTGRHRKEIYLMQRVQVGIKFKYRIMLFVNL